MKADIDDIMRIKLCTEFFSFERDVYIYLCYVVPKNSTRQDMIGRDVFDRLQMDLAYFDSQSECENWYMITGDFNARTSNAADFVSHDTDYYIPLPNDYTANNDTRRASEDATSPITEYGHKLLNLCSITGLRIMKSRVGMDKGIGKYTCEAPNGSSV